MSSPCATPTRPRRQGRPRGHGATGERQEEPPGAPTAPSSSRATHGRVLASFTPPSPSVLSPRHPTHARGLLGICDACARAGRDSVHPHPQRDSQQSPAGPARGGGAAGIKGAAQTSAERRRAWDSRPDALPPLWGATRPPHSKGPAGDHRSTWSEPRPSRRRPEAFGRQTHDWNSVTRLRDTGVHAQKDAGRSWGAVLRPQRAPDHGLVSTLPLCHSVRKGPRQQRTGTPRGSSRREEHGGRHAQEVHPASRAAGNGGPQNPQGGHPLGGVRDGQTDKRTGE